MSGVRIGIVGDDGFAWGVAIPVEILDPSLQEVQRLAVPLLESVEVTLDPGTYLVRGSLPSGAIVRTTVTAIEGETVFAELALPAPRKPWLAWPTLLGLAAPAWVEERRRFAALDAEPFDPPRLRTWERLPHDAFWREDTWALDLGPEDGCSTLRGTAGEPHALRMLQVETAEASPRFVAIPPTPAGVRVLLTRHAWEQNAGGDLAVQIVTADGGAETLLRYLAHGQTTAAVTLERLLGPAFDAGLTLNQLDAPYLSKRPAWPDPAAAAVGLYFQLRTGGDDRLGERPANYAERFDWIPDGPVICAWQLLRRPDAERHLPTIRAHLLEAARRGVPVYSDGLQLLVEGLELVAGYDDDPVVDAAHEEIRCFAAAADLSQPLTTFLGAAPDEPSGRAPGSGRDAGSGFRELDRAGSAATLPRARTVRSASG